MGSMDEIPHWAFSEHGRQMAQRWGGLGWASEGLLAEAGSLPLAMWRTKTALDGSLAQKPGDWGTSTSVGQDGMGMRGLNQPGA